ncbi:FGGY family carbohydrate kinase [Agriterribacter sp.]|uniref:FGGY-family carbohydrate kinase n=1 Tax=Agriterribacter sp. TaxID=2821509 RepID=UPI002B6F421F|nr:FGGY family carbohydrate kinase [Agriterribacter sp.]HRO45231.1 FGGY family carbohydrate kinase [Agriterribacter sp.]HRQ16834.1 FGGY family carbohydrate kinase [Agriterribacter sp.]
MMSNSVPVIAIYDIGKTNKKVFLFNEAYEVVYEKSATLPETTDEDGYPCENIELLTRWITESFSEITELKAFTIVAVNFTSYGASFVHIDKNGNPLTPLYNYLKPYPEDLKKKFYGRYGGEIMLSIHTASPVLGSLNSGMQLYRLKYEQKTVFDQIVYSLHLPQYISYLLTAKACSDITSIGCHTNLWNFPQHNYHEWVYREGLIDKLPPVFASDEIVKEIIFSGKKIRAGVGLHDSSAALIPYLTNFREPFVLISTGTWSISFNPFNSSPLTVEELQQDCLCYLTYHGRPVKASRLFAGYEHEQQVKRLAAHFNKQTDHYTTVKFSKNIIDALRLQPEVRAKDAASITVFPERDLHAFTSYEQAYHQLMLDIMSRQINATGLVLEGTDVKRIFVDGGFGKNPLYMHLLAEAFPGIEVYAASIAQATALGAALAIHPHWNSKPAPADTIKLMYYNTSTFQK